MNTKKIKMLRLKHSQLLIKISVEQFIIKILLYIMQNVNKKQFFNLSI